MKLPCNTDFYKKKYLKYEQVRLLERNGDDKGTSPPNNL